MTTAIVRVFPSRQASDLVVTSVLRVPGCAAERENLSPVLSCERCGNVPTFDPAPDNPKVPIELKLSMVQAPDRDSPVFLGPECLSFETQRYISRSEKWGG